MLPNLTNDGAFCPLGAWICTRLGRAALPQTATNAYKPTMRWVLGVIGVLGVGLGLGLLLGLGTSTPPPPGTDQASEETGFADSAGDQPAAPANGAFADEAGEPAGLLDSAPPIVREDYVAGDGNSAGPSVLVLRGSDQQPVPNAAVYFVREGSEGVPLQLPASRLREFPGLSQTTQASRWEAPELLGQRTHTNANGIAQLPGIAQLSGGAGRWLCSALHDGEFGFVVVTARPGQHRITLEPDEQLLIAAQYDGRPDQPAAFVPVAVQHQHRPARAEECWRGTTDDRGQAIVRHFQLLRRERASSQPESFEERFAAIALLPLEPIRLTEFAGRPASNDPIVLSLPSMATMTAGLVDHAGKPLLSPALLRFAIIDPTIPPGAFPLDHQGLRVSVDKPVGVNTVTLPFLQIGRPLRLYARYPYARREPTSIEVAGPSNVAEPVVIKVPPHRSNAILAGRFLLPSGQPVANARVRLTIWRDDAVHTNAYAQTIADGQWDLVLIGNEQPGRYRVEVRYEQPAATAVDSAAAPAPSAWLGSTVELPAWPPGSRVELGTMPLQPLPALLSGIVVDDTGQAIAGATIDVQQEHVPQNGADGNNRPGRGIQSLSVGDLEVDLEVLRSRGRLQMDSNGWRRGMPQERWRSLLQLNCKSAADGTFAIYAPLPSGNLRVLADSRDHCSTALPFTGLTNNLRIVIPRNGVLTGTVLLPEWMPNSAVTLVANRRADSQSSDEAGDAQRPQTSASTGVANSLGGRIALQPLRPGRYDVVVNMRNLPAPLATIEDVVVHPGETKEPRLQALDLRQALYRYKLRARDDAGQAMLLDGPIHARMQQPDGSLVEAGFRWQAGVAELLLMHASVELTFFGRGFETHRQQYAPGEHEVFLKPLRPALVNLPGARALSGATRKVRISALLQGDTGLPSSLSGQDQLTGSGFSFARWDLGRSSGGWLEQSDQVEIPLMVAGTYQLLFRAHATESSNTPQTSVVLGNFELKPDGTTVTTVPLDSLAITEALRAIDKQHEQRSARNNSRRNR